MAKKPFAQQRRAAVEYFNERYGTNAKDLASWQQLCVDIGVVPENSITKCKKNLKRYHVNIMNFVAAMKAGNPVRTFSSIRALSNYMNNVGSEAFLPLGHAKQNDFLKFLLIPLM